MQAVSMPFNCAVSSRSFTYIPRVSNGCTYFSRSYCYTVWSVIRIILSFVCLSVSDAAHCGSEGWCTGLKVVSALFLAGNFLFTSLDTFAIRWIVEPQNAAKYSRSWRPCCTQNKNLFSRIWEMQHFIYDFLFTHFVITVLGPTCDFRLRPVLRVQLTIAY